MSSFKKRNIVANEDVRQRGPSELSGANSDRLVNAEHHFGATCNRLQMKLYI